MFDRGGEKCPQVQIGLTLSDLGGRFLVHFHLYVFPYLLDASEISKFNFLSYSNDTVTIFVLYF